MADQVIHCSSDHTIFTAPWDITLEDGTVVIGNGNTWPLPVEEDFPALKSASRVGTSGAATLRIDNSETIASFLDEREFRALRVGTTLCSADPSAGGVGGLLAGLATLLGLALRRSSKESRQR